MAQQNHARVATLAHPVAAPAQSLHLIVVGYGNIASYWLRHFASQLPEGVCVAAVINSTGLVAADALPAELTSSSAWQPVTRAQGTATEPRVVALLQQLNAQQRSVAVIDLTASKAVSRYYPTWVAAGAHLICANKYAGSSALDFYLPLRALLEKQQRHWLHNTTVGAGLPIQSTISERLACQDQIIAIEGNFSGSLSWVFQHYRRGDKVSDWLRKAADLGMTEPDPRNDLAGMDVARKLLILARESGWQLELADLAIENLVPPALRQGSVAQFWQHIDELDSDLARREGNQFHYIGRIEKLADGRVVGGAKLQSIEPTSSYASLPAGNANFRIQSRQYCDNPLLIQGPGAGREVTAAGVHSDIIHLHQRLGS